MRTRTALLAVIAASMAVSACTVEGAVSATPSPVLAVAGATPPSVTPTKRPTPRPTSTPTPTPRATPSSTPGPIATPGPSGMPTPFVEAPGTPHVDPALEAFLPQKAPSGVFLLRTSMPGSVFTSGSDMCLLICGDEPYRYAKELGVGIDDITIGFAISDTLGLGMIAYRARGAKTDELIPARIAIGGYTGHGFSHGLPVTVAGRPAMYLDAGFGDQGEYLMTRHDVLFIVLGEAPSKGTCSFGRCASLPPGPWTVPSYVTEALGGVP